MTLWPFPRIAPKIAHRYYYTHIQIEYLLVPAPAPDVIGALVTGGVSAVGGVVPGIALPGGTEPPSFLV